MISLLTFVSVGGVCFESETGSEGKDNPAPVREDGSFSIDVFDEEDIDDLPTFEIVKGRRRLSTADYRSDHFDPTVFTSMKETGNRSIAVFTSGGDASGKCFVKLKSS